MMTACPSGFWRVQNSIIHIISVTDFSVVLLATCTRKIGLVVPSREFLGNLNRSGKNEVQKARL